MARVQSIVCQAAIGVSILTILFGGVNIWATCQQNATVRRAPFYCYKCIVFDGIDDPVCEYPVARKAKAASCFSKKCVKLQIYSAGHKEGQSLKSWIMKRDCLIPSFVTEEYAGLDPPCESCGRANGSVRIYQRLNAELRGNAVRSIFAEDLDYKIIMMCKCCTNLCNFEEGFDLAYFQDKKTSSSKSSAMSVVRETSFSILLACFNIINLA